MTVPELADRRDGLQVLDVRERDEWLAGHIPGSLHTPYHDLRELPDGLDAGRPVAVICASGQRAAVGASLVQRHGASEVWHVVDGGVPAWERAGHPVDTG
jgi:rhodanese-related sulfurtransferase